MGVDWYGNGGDGKHTCKHKNNWRKHICGWRKLGVNWRGKWPKPKTHVNNKNRRKHICGWRKLGVNWCGKWRKQKKHMQIQRNLRNHVFSLLFSVFLMQTKTL